MSLTTPPNRTRTVQGKQPAVLELPPTASKKACDCCWLIGTIERPIAAKPDVRFCFAQGTLAIPIM